MQKVTQDTTSPIFWVDLEENHKAKVVYKLDGQEMHIISTLIPEEVRGKGYGKVMMEAVLPEIEAQGYRIVPVCPYVIKYMATHPEWAHLLA
ncbi:acetyltransferase family protein [Vibrio harveyi]|uniref:GNAT family N-acetyltransferase n=1 Tax=Vibrio harveyi TaxID=669 RepID=UPI00028DA2DF|nr:GNAT family N-acetyltransferase [Vibrio harveyi]EKM14694.1 acetyltransferase family protein [Vibrio harveyi]